MRFIDTTVEYHGFWGSFWDLIWWFLLVFVFFAYLMALFSIIADIFGDRKLSGWAKAVWLIFLIFLPVLTALVYLIARGGGMADRQAAAASEYKAASDSYIKSVAGTATPADQIAQAKALLDAGTISAAEFEALKAKALA